MKKLLLFICALFVVVNLSAQRIAVLDFNAGVGISQSDVDGISAIFNTYFSPKGYTLVERTRIDRVIDEQNFQRGKLTQSQMVRIGQILNVSKVVIGDVNIVMNQYNVDVRVVNVESGTIAAKDGVTWSPASSYRSMMSGLATRLADKIAINQVVGYQQSYSRNNYSQSFSSPTPQSFVENANCGLNMKMIYVEGGTFTMGATSEQGGDSILCEEPIHSVTLDSFYIAECEVTQAQWVAIMGSNPSNLKGDNRPVECVSWFDAQEFCNRLSSATGKTYMLPTEAQWEYAARGGKRSRNYKYSGLYSLDAVGWYDGNSGGQTRPVKGKRPNELGVYDMTGNVWEWCQDWADSYSSESQNNPAGPSSGSNRVLRGGGWRDPSSLCHISVRGARTPSDRRIALGLRLVLVP